MHYFQQRYLRENRAFAALAGLETIDLPNKGLLSGLELRVWGLCGAGTTLPDVWLHDRITRVEVIVNGSQVVKSYDARQLLAMMLYKRTPHYSHDMKNMASASCEEVFYINFGRHYHDLEYMLDLGQVNDPELRITHNFGLAAAEGWTNGVAMAVIPQYSVIPHILRDPAITPKGYIKTSEIYRFPQLANRQENMIIPRGPTYSNLYLQSWYQGLGWGNVLDHYEVNINSDDIIPIRSQLLELLTQNIRMYGLMEMTQKFYGLGNQMYPWPLEVGNANGEIGAGFADLEFMEFDLWGLAQPVGLRTVTTGAQVAGNPLIRSTIRGAAPFAVLAIPLFDPWDESTWSKTAELGDFWVRVELGPGAAAPGVIKLLGDEVVTRYVTPSWP